MTLDIRRPGRIGAAAIPILLALAHTVNDAFMATLSALLPHLKDAFGASAVSLAGLVAVLTISASAMQPLLGGVADGAGARPLLIGGLSVSAVSMSLLGAADSLWTLALLLALGGLGSAAFHPAATSVVTSAAGTRAALAAGGFTAGGMLGLAVGPAVVLAYVDRWGLAQVPWLMLPGLLFAAVMWRVLPDRKAHGPGNGRLSWRVMTRGEVGWLLATSSLINLIFLTFLSTTPLWLVDAHGVDSSAGIIAMVLGAMAVTAGAGVLIGGVIGGRWGFRRTTLVSLAASILPLGLMLGLPLGWGTVISAMVGGALLNMSVPLLIVQAQEAVPDAPAAAAGVVVGLATAIAGLLYVGVGTIQGAVGFGPALALTLLLVAPAMMTARQALPVRSRLLRAMPEGTATGSGGRPGTSRSRDGVSQP